VKRSFLLLVNLFLCGFGFGQNYPLYNGYVTNPYLVNPAEAASNFTHAFVNYRNQWDGLVGAPKIGTLGFRTLLNETRAGIGFKVSSFKRGFLNTTDASFSYAYGVPLDKQNKLFFGLSGGLISNSVDWQMVSDNSDPALTGLKGGIAPSMAFGVLVKNSSGFNVGLVLPQMFRPQTLNDNFAIAAQDNAMLVAYYSNWVEQAKVNSHNKSKKTHRSSKNKGSPLEVFSIVRYSSKIGTQVEATAKFNFQSHVWVSTTYRKVSGIIPGIGFNLNQLSLGYYYESGIAGDIPLKSHEISLGLRIGNEKKFRGEAKPAARPTVPQRPRLPGDTDINEPKISKQPPKKMPEKKEVVAKNTKTTKTTPEVKKDPAITPEVKKDVAVVTPEVKKDAVVAPEVKKDPVEAPEVKKDVAVVTPEVKKDAVVTPEVKKDPVVAPEVKKDVAAITPEVKKDPLVVPEVKKDVAVVVPEEKKDPVVPVEPSATHHTRLTETVDQFATPDEKQLAEEQDKIARLSDHKENPTEEHNEEGHPHAERHEFVVRGNHVSEMDLGDYVIVGVFKGEANAKHMSDELKKLGFSEVDYGFLTNKAVWYVHIAGSNDIDEARSKRNKYRKMKMFKDAWLLTVHQ
jgi:type IX secretion system PorP/SprF family membrane protein